MNQDRTIRLATLIDVPLIMAMCDHSRTIMRASGNMTQWTNGYPSEEQIIKDITFEHGFLLLEHNVPIGYFAFIIGDDPTYKVIDGGQWLEDNTPYGTIHRLACAPGHHEIGRDCFDWCASKVASLRADTHADNSIMRHIMEQLQFTYCGIIHVADGTPRLAFQLLTYPMVDSLLKEYVEQNILPQYNYFDPAHQLNHIRTVMAQSMELSSYFSDTNKNMIYTIAAYHDIGISEGREHHHTASGRIVRNDKNLTRWFSADQIETMAQAVEDHRASSHNTPRSLYGKIVAEADRDIEPLTIIRRTIQYGISHYPQLDIEGHWMRMLDHLHEKYSPSGYLKLYIPQSRNSMQLRKLWELIDNTDKLRQIFESLIKEMDDKLY